MKRKFERRGNKGDEQESHYLFFWYSGQREWDELAYTKRPAQEWTLISNLFTPKKSQKKKACKRRGGWKIFRSNDGQRTTKKGVYQNNHQGRTNITWEDIICRRPSHGWGAGDGKWRDNRTAGHKGRGEKSHGCWQ